jgi:putative DNA primase/helicase
MSNVISLPQPSQSVFLQQDQIPQELVLRDRWVCWRTYCRDGKPAKAPVDPNNGRLASVADPRTWSDFVTARDARERFSCTGIGIVLTGDGLVAIDLDHCVRRDCEKHHVYIEPWAFEIVLSVGSYTEFSPSRNGLHVFGFGSIPQGRRRSSRF